MPWLIVGVLAFGAGALFRLSKTMGIPALQMLGFWLLVALGLIVARALRHQQSAAGRAQVAAILSAAEGWRVAGSSPESAVVVGPGGVGVLVFDEMADYGRGPRARRRLAAARERAASSAGVARAVLAGCEAAAGVPVHPCLVLLRRRAPESDDGLRQPGEVAMVNPEGVAGFLRALPEVGGFDETRRIMVANCLRRTMGDPTTRSVL